MTLNLGRGRRSPPVLRRPTRRDPARRPDAALRGPRGRVLSPRETDPQRAVPVPVRRLQPGLCVCGGASCVVAGHPALYPSGRASRHAFRPYRVARVLQPERPGVLVPVHIRRGARPGRHLLCVGELLRHHRTGPGLDVCEHGIRCAPGTAAVRADRKRCQSRCDPGRVPRARARAPAGHDQPAAGARPAHPAGGLCREPGLGAPADTRGRLGGTDTAHVARRSPRARPRVVLSDPHRGTRVRGGHGDAVDAIPVQPGRRGPVRRRSRPPYSLLRDVQFLARRGGVHHSALRDRAGASAFRRGHDHSAAARGPRCRVGVDLHRPPDAVRRVDQRVRSGTPVLDRQGHLRAAVSAPAGPGENRGEGGHRSHRRLEGSTSGSCTFRAPDSDCVGSRG
jgi:hypothetical protein